MQGRIVNLTVVLALLFLVGCASSRDAYVKLRSDVSKGDINSAVKLVKSDKFYPEERSKLLKLLELGTLQHIQQNYYQSLKTFDKAKELSDRLFTVSISKKAMAAAVNSNADNYYGEIYERSLIRFYLALNHYMLFQRGSYEAHIITKKVKVNDKELIKEHPIKEMKLSRTQKRNHLSASRASLLEWDSVLNNYHTSLSGQTTYKFDLTSRLFGAFIHEQMGTSADRQIALKLYQDAKKVLFRNYNLYPAYNKKFKRFTKDYKKLPNMPRNLVKTNYVQETKYATNLLSYIDGRVKAIKSRKNNNVTFVMQQGYVTEKKAKEIKFPVPAATIPVGDIGPFVSACLGAVPSIEFELPKVEQKKLSESIQIVVRDEKGKKVKEANAVVVNPISDIAYQAMDNKVIRTYGKIGARLVVKHLAAITAAYATAQKAGTMAGTMVYSAAAKGINASEKADLRFWSTLPHSLRMASMKLRPGKYSLSFKVTKAKKTVEKNYGSFVVPKKKQTLINLNVF